MSGHVQAAGNIEEFTRFGYFGTGQKIEVYLLPSFRTHHLPIPSRTPTIATEGWTGSIEPIERAKEVVFLDLEACYLQEGGRMDAGSLETSRRAARWLAGQGKELERSKRLLVLLGAA